ncbi:hypothetical protein PC116_g2602 [Phytophthora cactorum]|nr:hypothetical protein PC123_g2070 [Phytophthora cactorum]KAG4249657.1 hypothetical protein PC116_g2602 [Phytophthora cactorum]
MAISTRRVLSIMTSLVANSLQSPMQKQASQSTDKRVYISCGHVGDKYLEFSTRAPAEGGNQSGKLDEETINSTDE